MSLKTAAIEVVRPISEALVYVLNSGEAFEAFQKYVVFLIALLFTIIGFNFRSSNISPLETHYAIFLLFLVAIFVYGLAYVLIAVQPRDSVYLSKLRYSNQQLFKHFFQGNEKTMTILFKCCPPFDSVKSCSLIASK
nr:hypothetical protein CFP56_75633 [Quercus suber]